MSDLFKDEEFIKIANEISNSKFYGTKYKEWCFRNKLKDCEENRLHFAFSILQGITITEYKGEEDEH